VQSSEKFGLHGPIFLARSILRAGVGGKDIRRVWRFVVAPAMKPDSLAWNS
jgi:hypothetical protein